MEPLKAPGPDGIQAILLKQSPDIVDRAMINLYKASHILGHIPKVLRETTGILIPKPGKKTTVIPRHIVLSHYHQYSLKYRKS